VNTENHLGWRTSIFDQLSTLLTDSHCGCFFDPIPEKILQLLEDLYSNTFSCVRVDGAPWFETSSGVRQGCVAPELFLEPMDWITNRAAHKGFLGVTACGRGDLYGFRLCDYADDVSLLASMLEILVLALEILYEESSQIGLEINWSKTKLQVFDDTSTPPSKVSYSTEGVSLISTSGELPSVCRPRFDFTIYTSNTSLRS